MLSFADPVYEVGSGQELEVEVKGSYLPAGATIPIQILYNPQLLSFVSAEQGGVTLRSFNASADSSRGLITLTLETANQGGASGEGVSIAHMKLRGDKSGISYLVYRASTIKVANGVDVSAQVRASRVVVK
jgi:hypothetical protein